MVSCVTLGEGQRVDETGCFKMTRSHGLSLFHHPTTILATDFPISSSPALGVLSSLASRGRSVFGRREEGCCHPSSNIISPSRDLSPWCRTASSSLLPSSPLRQDPLQDAHGDHQAPQVPALLQDLRQHLLPGPAPPYPLGGQALQLFLLPEGLPPALPPPAAHTVRESGGLLTLPRWHALPTPAPDTHNNPHAGGGGEAWLEENKAGIWSKDDQAAVLATQVDTDRETASLRSELRRGDALMAG